MTESSGLGDGNTNVFYSVPLRVLVIDFKPENAPLVGGGISKYLRKSQRYFAFEYAIGTPNPNTETRPGRLQRSLNDLLLTWRSIIGV